ncbi:hypothetical protein DPX16_13539 [Anabarilius grahami]|uniref:Uncharacterized protein n=1 Tax=Anabarilius grahami TaxID=495550 RepID=A0A3N0YCV8_ANAGA|nr:hypothetical protein DPX16_13539 [Anabarilius grahami]
MNQVLVQSQCYFCFGVGLNDEPSKNRFASPWAREPPQSQVLCHYICLIFHSNASVVTPNTNTPGLFEMHLSCADQSVHDTKAQRERTKSTRSHMLSKCSRSAPMPHADRSTQHQCISNQSSINNGGR